ncbi:VOC family protein [Streptomyces sp. NPDC094034]|uniref:VOC family protein n=1 Tax=Streptomyces sp. NPDC094034 TaxID=3155309 RepID=UPI0033213CCE
MKLEVVVIPVTDVDRAKDFYTALGWRLDADIATDEHFRVVQVTPPGSPASVIFGTSVTSQPPGTAQGLHLIVEDIEAVYEELKQRGAGPSEVFHDAGGVFHHAGTDARVPGPDPKRSSYGSFLSFNDPDGNGWVVQEVTTRLPGRQDPSVLSFGSPAALAAALRRASAADPHHDGTHHTPHRSQWDWYANQIAGEQTGSNPSQ